MPIYKGNTQIDEIYHGNKLIAEVYKGKTLVYTMNPFEPGTQLSKLSPGDYKDILPKGVYRIALCGAGNNGTQWWAGSYGWGSSGGSGAFVELVFYNPKKQEIVIHAPDAANGDAYMNLGGERMITAGGGTAGGTNVGGKGGTYSFNPALDVLDVIKEANGNNGGVALSGSTGGAPSVSNYDDWGRGDESGCKAGGELLIYVRYVR